MFHTCYLTFFFYLLLRPLDSYLESIIDNNTINSNVSAPIETTTNVQPINTTNTAPIRIDKKTEYKNLLDSTQFKFGDDYDKKNTLEWEELKLKRAEAREFIRANK